MLPQRPPLDWRREYLPIRQRYSVFPNILGAVGSKFMRSGDETDYASGAFNYYQTEKGQIAGGQYFFQSAFEFNASRSSNLYKDGLTEVRVNGLYVLHLVRAY